MKGRSVEAYQADARYRKKKAYVKPQAFSFLLQKQKGQDRREKRRCGGDNAHVGSAGIGQGNVFKQVVEGDPEEPRSRKCQFLLQGGPFQPPRADDEQGDQPQQKTGKQDLHRLKIPKQDLRGNEGGPPDQYGQKCRQMSSCLFVLHFAFSRTGFSLREYPSNLILRIL